MTDDLVVVGGGMGGLATAARAAQLGAAVTVLEKADRLGGSAALSAGILWTAPDLETLRRVTPGSDHRLGARLVEGFDAALAWLRSLGVELSDRWHGQMGFGVACRVDPVQLVECLRATIVDEGGRVMLRTAAEVPLTAGGRIRGVQARCDGRVVELEGEAVVLATGGFQGDRELVRELIGPGAARALLRSNPHSCGDGLRIGREAGTALAGSTSFYGHLLPSPLRDYGPEHFLPLTQYHSRASLLVNLEGRRFMDETRGDEVANQLVVREPGGRAVLLCDERVRRDGVVAAPYPHGQVVDRFAGARRAGARFAAAATIGELVERVAAWGVPAAALATTIARRADPPGAVWRDPLAESPFYALEVQPSITFPFAGLRVDEDARALDGSGAPVPGLFAVGADAGGVQEVGYVGGLVLGAVFGPRAAEAALDVRSDASKAANPH
jgi:succinate dehydrogenase/fumarate reductase flavoprotein subunit